MEPGAFVRAHHQRIGHHQPAGIEIILNQFDMPHRDADAQDG